MTIKRWAPKSRLSRRMAMIMVAAHREGVIELGGFSSVQLMEWRWMPSLTVGARMKIGALWREHGQAIIQWNKYGDLRLAPEQQERLEQAASEAS